MIWFDELKRLVRTVILGRAWMGQLWQNSEPNAGGRQTGRSPSTYQWKQTQGSRTRLPKLGLRHGSRCRGNSCDTPKPHPACWQRACREGGRTPGLVLVSKTFCAMSSRQPGRADTETVDFVCDTKCPRCLRKSTNSPRGCVWALKKLIPRTCSSSTLRFI